MLKVGLISIGDELLLGNTINTNAAWLSSQLIPLGVVINTSIVIQDNEQIIINSLKEVGNENDIVITTGGLGPTKDDITKKSICKYFDSELVEDENTKKHLIEYFKRRNRQMNATHWEQALIPSCSVALINNVGTAPGIYTAIAGKHYFNLPGIPLEMKNIFNDNIKNLISNVVANSNFDFFTYYTIFTTGIVESEIYSRVKKIEEEYDIVKFAYLPSYSGVKLRIGYLNSDYLTKQKIIENIIQTVKSLLETYIIEENCDINIALSKLLSENNYTISVAESCTGGALGKLLTDEPGSAKIFMGGFIVYSNEVKNKLLNVSKETLVNFGAVSEETAIEMAENCRKILDTDFALSITGVAGPSGGSETKPVGTVCIGLADRNKTKAMKFNFLNNREANRELSKFTALSLLYRKLKYNIEL